MSNKFKGLIKTTKGFMSKHSPEILTGIGVTGMITSTVLAVKATPKALAILEAAEEEKGDKLTPVETIKAAWKPYIPAVVTGVASAACIIGASAVSTKRNAALATAYAISEKTLLTYRDKVVETLGEKKEKEIREKIAQDEIDKHPVASSQVIVTSKGNSLCKDSLSGRYFRSDVNEIKKAVNKLNREMTYQNYISLDEFYFEIGLESTDISSRMGWNLDRGLIDIDFGACVTDDGEPCLVIEYMVRPEYDFDKLF